MPLVEMWVGDYARAAVVLLGALFVGYPVARRTLRRNVALPLMILVGLAGIDLIVCLLAWLDLFTSVSMIVVGVLAAGLSAACLRSDLPKWKQRLPRFSASMDLWWCTIVLAAVVLAMSWFVTYPVTIGDAANYHLPLAANLIAHHGFSYNPFIRFSFFPQGNEALFAVVLLMSRNGSGPAALEFATLSVVVLALPAWFSGSGRHPVAGLAAGLVVLASPVVIWVATAPMIDSWVLTFILAGILVGLDAGHRLCAPRAGFVLMGVLIGEAAAAKYTGLVYGGFALIGVLIAAGSAQVRTALGAFLIGAAGLVVPWYAWPLHVTGDPLYPFGTQVFGNPKGIWNLAEIHLQTIAQRGIRQGSVGAIVSRDVAYLLGHVSYNTGSHRSPLSWWLGSGYLGVLLGRARRSRTFWGLAVTGILSIGFFVTQSADPRMFVPAIGAFAVLAGLATQFLLDTLGRSAGQLMRWSPLLPVFSAAAVLVTIWSSAHYILGFSNQYGGPPATAAAKTAYLSRRLSCYRSVSWLNQHEGVGYRVWAEACESVRYYTRGVLIGGAFSVGADDRILRGYASSLPPPGTLWHRLEPLHVGWLILPAMPAVGRDFLTKQGQFSFVTAAGPDDIFEVNPASG